MHTLSVDGRNLRELLQGFIAAQRHAPKDMPVSAIATLDIADVLYSPENGNITLRQMVAIIDDVGQSSPSLADMLAAHFAVAASNRHMPIGDVTNKDVFSVNNTEPKGSVQITLDHHTKELQASRHGTALSFGDNAAFVSHLTNLLWITHSAALSGVLTRIAEIVRNPLNDTDVAVSTASTRAVVYAAAERYDHAGGYGPYSDGDGYGQHFDVTGIATVARQAVFAHLNLLASLCEPPLRDALGVVSGRAVHQFGAPPTTGATR